MVEKANDIIKNKTIKITPYESVAQRKELKVKTPFNAIEKGYELDLKIVKTDPNEFKNKILFLKYKQVENTQQPCEN